MTETTLDNTEVQRRLANMDQAWDQAAVPDVPDLDTPLPEGLYQAEVERFAFHQVGQPSRLKLRTQFKVVGGQFAGRRESTFHDLEDPERLGWTKKHLATLGLEVSPLSSLLSRLEQAVGVGVEIKVKHTKSKKPGDSRVFTNVYLVRLLDGTSQPAPGTSDFMGPADFGGFDGNAHPFNDDQDIPF